MLAAAAGGWTLISGVILLVVHRSAQSAFDELAVDATILPIVVVGYAWIQRQWPARPAGAVPPLTQARRAVAQVRIGDTVVGNACRIRGRLLVTSADVVNRALNRRAGETAPPPERSRVALFFPAGPGSEDDVSVSARVLEWGPGRMDLVDNDVVVLQTVERIPRRIPSLRIATRPYEGCAHIILPGGEVDDELRPSLEVRVRDHHLIGPPPAPVNSTSGAPVLSFDPTDNDLIGEVAALIGAPGRASGESSTATTGSARDLIEAREIRSVLHTVSRRELLRTGMAAGTVIALGGAGSLARNPWATAGAPPAPVDVLRGAGWDDLFENPRVRSYLLGKNFHIEDDVTRFSGVESLNPGRDLSSFDFITAPNPVIADALTKKVGTPFFGATSQPICSDRMVLVVSQEVAPFLNRGGLMIRPEGDRSDRFDVLKYLMARRDGRTWADIGATELRVSGDPVKVAYSDPAYAGGGQMFLWLLTDVLKHSSLGLKREWLWGQDGPLYERGTDKTQQLFRKLEDPNTSEQMVFVYEHDAVSFLLGDPARLGKYVILETSPVLDFDQIILTNIDGLSTLFARPEREFVQILVEEFHLRLPNLDFVIDDLLSGPLAKATWVNDPSTPVGERRRGVRLNVKDALDLMHEVTANSNGSS
jgi:hypothetical protein